MHRRSVCAAVIAWWSLVFLSAMSSGAAGQPVLRTLGWHELPGTALQAVCPPNGFGNSTYEFYDSCRNVTEAWNSAVMDTRRNRLVVWGGGHSDYLGNELYEVDLNSLKVNRITDPGLPVSETGCPESIVNDTQPNSRHTYDGMAYIENVDRLWVFSGSLARCGFFSRGTWTFDFARLTWEKHTPAGDLPTAGPGIVSAYDSNTGLVFLDDGNSFYSYEFKRNRYERIAGSNGIGYHSTAVIDPVRRKFVIVGAGRVHVYDISQPKSFFGPSRRILRTRGGDPIVMSAYPGLAYDPATDRIVGWNGGDSVYSLDLETGIWTPITHQGGPGPALRNGTFKRWGYSPASGVFVVVNEMMKNAFAFRLSPAR
jgi:hypothetical protein